MEWEGSKNTELGVEEGETEAAVIAAGSVFLGGFDAFFMVKPKTKMPGKGQCVNTKASGRVNKSRNASALYGSDLGRTIAGVRKRIARRDREFERIFDLKFLH